MFNKSYSRLNLSPDMAKKIEEIEKEISDSNFRQAKLGKRVPFNAQSIGVSTTLESLNDYHEGNHYTEEVLQTSDPTFYPKERLISKIAKDTTN